jgi:hypothetical protein
MRRRNLRVTELIAGIQTDKVTMWIERGSLRYRGLSWAVEKWLPQIRDNREAIAAELRYRDRPGDVRRLSLRVW